MDVVWDTGTFPRIDCELCLSSGHGSMNCVWRKFFPEDTIRGAKGNLIEQDHNYTTVETVKFENNFTVTCLPIEQGEIGSNNKLLFSNIPDWDLLVLSYFNSMKPNYNCFTNSDMEFVEENSNKLVKNSLKSHLEDIDYDNDDHNDDDEQINVILQEIKDSCICKKCLTAAPTCGYCFFFCPSDKWSR